MPLPLTNLDTRRWNDLAEEARAMIPRYARSWTDHNLHDPGITTIQMLAWLVEQDVYQLNRIPEAHRRKFLALVGIQPRRPQAAQLVVGVTPESVLPVDVPAGTEFTAKTNDSGPVPYTATQALVAIPAHLVAIMVQTGPTSAPVDYTRHWSEQGSFAPFGDDPMPGAVLWLGFDQPLPQGRPVRLALTLAGDRSGSEERRRIIAEAAAQAEACRPPLPAQPPCADTPVAPAVPVPPATLKHHSVRLVWELYAGGKWLALDPDAGEVVDDTRAFTLDGSIQVQVSLAMSALDAGTGKSLYFLRARIQAGDFDAPPSVRDLVLNAITLKQATPLVQIWRIQAGAAVSGTPPAVPGRARAMLKLDGSGNITDLAFVSDESVPELAVLFYQPPSASDPGAIVLDLVLVGYGDGTPDQTMNLPGVQIDDDTLQVYNLESGSATGWLSWEARPDFDASNGRDRHLLLDSVTGRLYFGNGDRAHIPAAGIPLLARAQVTLADAGNIRPKQTLELTPSLTNWPLFDLADFETQVAARGPDKLFGANPATVWGDWGTHYAEIKKKLGTITNPGAAQYGAGQETLTHAAGRAYDLLHTVTRAVTVDDYESLALETPGTHIARARALPGHHPSFPCLAAPGVVTVIVVPAQRRAKPIPSIGLLDTVRRYLNRRRILGTHIEVVAPTYVTIQVTARVQKSPNAKAARVSADIIAALDTFLNPVTGGPAAIVLPVNPSQAALLSTATSNTPPAPPGVSVITPAAPTPPPLSAAEPPAPGWPFGRDVYRTEILQVIDTVPGVDHVLSLELASDGGPGDCGNLCLGPTNLVVPGTHSIEVV